MASVAIERRKTEERQRKCKCGGRVQCEHEREEEIKSGMEGGMVRESEDLAEVKRREKSVERKLEEMQQRKDELTKLERAKKNLAEMAKNAELEGYSSRSRARGRGRPWIDESPERYV